MTMTTLDLLLLAVLPYLVFFNFFMLTIQRYRRQPFTYSSLSSQFLENREHFWGVVSFHYGILGVFLGHLLGLLIPRQILLWNARPLRLYVMEIAGLAFALMTLVGLLGILHRRMAVSRARTVTSAADWVLYVLLFVQLVVGIYGAVMYPWVSSWFATSASPYLWSLFTFRPDVSFLVTMPWIVKLHIITGWLIFGVFPYTRLVHLLVMPVPYLWRKPEVVRWYGIRIRPEHGARARS